MNRRWRIRDLAAAGPLVPALIAGIIAGCAHPPASVVFQGLTLAFDSTGRNTYDTTAKFHVDRNGTVHPGACTDSMALSRDSLQHVTDSVRSVLVRNQYCEWDIPEFNDDQRLSIGGNALGPLAHVFAAPIPAQYPSASSYENFWINVAIVAVDTMLPAGQKLPGVYQALQLQPGSNCLYLHHDSASNQWQALMVPGDQKTCDPVQSSVSNAVAIVNSPDQPTTHPGDYAPVARWVEGKAGETFIGVRCGNAWCEIGADNQGKIRPPSFGTPTGKSYKWRIRGWFGHQQLADVPANGTGPLVRGPEASIIPDDNLAQIDSVTYLKGWNHVATIHMPQPTAKYVGGPHAKGYGWKAGMNEMWLMSTLGKNSAGKDTLFWHAKFAKAQSALPIAHTFNVTMMSHPGYVVPGTARFRWSENDEQPWTACLAGCCMVDPDDIP